MSSCCSFDANFFIGDKTYLLLNVDDMGGADKDDNDDNGEALIACKLDDDDDDDDEDEEFIVGCINFAKFEFRFGIGDGFFDSVVSFGAVLVKSNTSKALSY